MRPAAGRVAVEATTRYRLMDAPGPVGAERTCKHGHVGAGRYKGGGCKECERLRNKNRRALNPEKEKAADRARYKLNPEKRRAAVRAWGKRNPEKIREFARRKAAKRLNLPEPTRPMPQTCEACGGPPGGRNGRYGSLNLDHDHITGKFRGWLCDRCNKGLGSLGDSIAGLEKAIEYLTRAADYDTIRDLARGKPLC